MTKTTKSSRPSGIKETFSLSLEELEVDVSAFLHYLKCKTGHLEKTQTGKPSTSYWSLIPKTLELCFSRGVEEFKIEKEVFSRTIWIVSKDVAEAERERRRAELFHVFQDAVTVNQISAIIRLLKGLKPESREKIRKAYLNQIEESHESSGS